MTHLPAQHISLNIKVADIVPSATDPSGPSGRVVGRGLPGWTQPIFPVFLAVVLGALVDRALWFDCSQILTPLLFYASLALVGLVMGWRGRKPVFIRFVGLLLALGAAGACYHHLAWHSVAPQDVGLFAGEKPQPVALRVIVSSLPEPLNRRSSPSPFALFSQQPMLRFTARVLALRDGTNWRPATGNILVYLSLDPEEDHPDDPASDRVSLSAHRWQSWGDYLPGDELLLFGRIRRCTPASNPGEFDMASYRRGDRILAEVNVPFPECLRRLDVSVWWWPLRILGYLRRSAARTIAGFLSEANQPLARAILLGLRGEIPEELQDRMLKTGTIHLLAISGLHVGILAGAVHFVLRWLGLSRATQHTGLIAAILFYTLISGAQPSTVRAASMFSLLALGAILYQPFWSLNGLALAGLLVLAFNPVHIFRAGPQLSFLAASVLMILGQHHFGAFAPPQAGGKKQRQLLTRLWRTVNRYLWPVLMTTLSVWVVAFPLVWFSFNIISPLGMILTPVLIPLVTVALLAGFLMLIVAPFAPPLAAGPAWVCEGMLTLSRTVIEGAETYLPWFTWQPAPPLWWVAGFYLLWIGYLLFCGRQTPRLSRRWQMGLGLWLLLGGVFLFSPQFPGLSARQELRLTTLAVGHGMCLVLETPDGRVWLYDVGSLAGPQRSARAAANYLWHRGHRRIDGVILSHADLDHYNGLAELLEYFSINEVLVSPAMFAPAEKREPGLEALERLLAEKHLPVRVVSLGDSWSWGDCHVSVLHPPKGASHFTDNAASLVLLVEYAGRKVLLTGDLEGPGLEAFLRQPPLRVDVLVAPHHGTPRSQPQRLVPWCQPEWIIVSGGISSLGSIDEFEQKVRLAVPEGQSPARVRNTAQVGAITVTIPPQGDGCDVQSFREAS